MNNLNEDIKILEEMLKTRKEQKEIIECAGGYCGNCNPDIKALENAIQTIRAYKELEEKLNETLNANLALVQGNANSIPVSLVEEIIEELEDEICGDDEYLGNRQCIELELLEKVQKELLEKR